MVQLRRNVYVLPGTSCGKGIIIGVGSNILRTILPNMIAGKCMSPCYKTL